MKVHQKRKIPNNSQKTKPMKWWTTKWVLKCILLIAIASATNQSLSIDSEDCLQKRQYNLTHDRTMINLPGSAYPIKVATMTTNRKRIRDSKRSRKKLCEKIQLLETQIKGALHGIIRVVLNGIANVGGVIHGMIKAIIIGWKSVIRIIIDESYETLTSFLNDENTGSTCFILRLLIKMTKHTSAKRYAVGQNNSGEYQNRDRDAGQTEDGHSGKKGENENESETAEPDKAGGTAHNGGKTYWYNFRNPPKEEEEPPDERGVKKPREEDPKGPRGDEDEEAGRGEEANNQPNILADELDEEELDEDEISIRMDVHGRTKIMTMNVRSAVSD